MKRKGDTLIEVALAIGIFSLVAITVVSVVSASLTGAQASLEVTLTRQELDSQAEALRFIHESYVSGSQSKETGKNDYKELWEAITAHAVSNSDESSAKNYNPTTCASLYNNKGLKNDNGIKPFIINVRKLASRNPEKVIFDGVEGEKYYKTDATFQPTTTYPRIFYGTDAQNNNLYNETEMYIKASNDVNYPIKRVEGMFIVVVKGKNNIVVDPKAEDEHDQTKSRASYYDFYIRSCWMPLNSDRASTISTVVRLYDPAVINY